MRFAILALVLPAGVLAQTAPQPGSAPQQQNTPSQQQDRPPPGPAAEPFAPAPSATNWQQSFDELWKERDRPGATAELHKILEPQLAADKRSFEVNWRLAALYNWEANQVEGDRRADLGHLAWDAAEIAVATHPKDVRAQYNEAVGIGLYAEGTGILKALSQGLEGKFRDHIGAALKADKDYLDGAPQVVWGRFFFKLPWPKRDDNQSIAILAPLMDSHPHNLRAKLYLADSVADEGSVDDGRKLVQQILDAPPGDDPPETRFLQKEARKWLAAHAGAK
jgi:hypothetical protein